jgi:hypothetical protein
LLGRKQAAIRTQKDVDLSANVYGEVASMLTTAILKDLGFKANVPLSALAVELLQQHMLPSDLFCAQQKGMHEIGCGSAAYRLSILPR